MDKQLERLKKKKVFIIRGDNFDFFVSDYFYSEEGKKISKSINDKGKRLDSIEFSYRLINHWEKHGLLSSNRPSGKGWRKYSLIDLVWTHIILELRKFGFPLEKIYRVKGDLEWANETYDYSVFPYLEVYTILAFGFMHPVFVLVFENGETEIATFSQYKQSIELFPLQNHIRINLNNILMKIMPDKNLKPQFNQSLELSAEELELIFMIRMKNYDSIRIKTIEGKIERFEATETVENDTRIIDILKKGDYQDIEIKQQDGKIVNIRRTIKKKV